MTDTSTVKAFEESRMTQDEIIMHLAEAIYYQCPHTEGDVGREKIRVIPFDEAKTRKHICIEQAKAALSVLLPHIREMVVALEKIKVRANKLEKLGGTIGAKAGNLGYAAEQALASIPKEWRGE